MDYFQFEDEKVQRMLRNAEAAYAGNYQGIEGIFHADVEVAIAGLGISIMAPSPCKYRASIAEPTHASTAG